jgi:type I restriction enzyme, S subunit
MKSEQGERRPRLRFPEFEDAGGWEEKQLDTLISTITPPKRIPTNEYLPAGKFPIIDQGQNDIAGWTNDQSALNMTSEPLIIFGDHTCALKLVNHPFAQGADGIKIIKGKDSIATEYPYHFLSLNPITSKEYKRHFSILRLKQIDYPRWESGEQTRIADCLSSLDSLIAAQTQKLNALRSHKRGLMQQLFPADGESVPRLRFPEFEGAGEWEEKKLSSFIQLVSGLHLLPDQYDKQGEVPYFTGPSDFTNETAGVSKWTGESANTANEKDTIITVKGSGVGEVWYLKIQSVALGRQLMAVRPRNTSSGFVHQFLLTQRNRLEDLASGNLIPGLSRSDILGLEASFPTLPEQQRIADCLSSLDSLITCQSDKIAELKTFKRGLMQQLFPAPDEGEEDNAYRY